MEHQAGSEARGRRGPAPAPRAAGHAKAQPMAHPGEWAAAISASCIRMSLHSSANSPQQHSQRIMIQCRQQPGAAAAPIAALHGRRRRASQPPCDGVPAAGSKRGGADMRDQLPKGHPGGPRQHGHHLGRCDRRRRRYGGGSGGRGKVQSPGACAHPASERVTRGEHWR